MDNIDKLIRNTKSVQINDIMIALLEEMVRRSEGREDGYDHGFYDGLNEAKSIIEKLTNTGEKNE